MSKGLSPGEDPTPFIGDTTVGDIHSIVADFTRRNLRKRGYKESWIGNRMDELMQALWCEVQRCKPKLDLRRRNWRSYILTTVSNYLKGWCMNNPHGSSRTPIWSRTMSESTREKWGHYHASIPVSSWKRPGRDAEEGPTELPSVFQGSDESRQAVSEFLLQARKIEDPITRAVVLLSASGYNLREIRDILRPVYDVSHQQISNQLKKGRALLA